MNCPAFIPNFAAVCRNFSDSFCDCSILKPSSIKFAVSLADSATDSPVAFANSIVLVKIFSFNITLLPNSVLIVEYASVAS